LIMPPKKDSGAQGNNAKKTMNSNK
jgi:hypothetical protein